MGFGCIDFATLDGATRICGLAHVPVDVLPIPLPVESCLSSVFPPPLPMFSIQATDYGLAVVTVSGGPTMDCWPKYSAEYKALYDRLGSFVLLFDLRTMGMPDFAVISAHTKLAMELKARTCRQVVGTIILADPEISAVVERLVRRGGQAAPFYATGDPGLAALRAAHMCSVIFGQKPQVRHFQLKLRSLSAATSAGPLPPSALASGVSGLMALLLAALLRSHRHILSQPRTGK